MGLDVLFWIVVLTWMVKRGTEDVTYAVRGQTPPRHRERMERIKRGESPARYGVRGWLDDATEDFLRANTQWRRSRAAKKAAARLDVPLDDLADAVREPRRHPHDPNNTRNCPVCKGEVVLDGRPCPRCLAEQQRRNAEWEPEWLTPGPNDDALLYGGRSVCPRCKTGQLAELSNGDRECVVCGPPARVRHETPEPAPQPPAPAPQPEPDTRPTARIYQFPNPKHAEKEIVMANSEVTGLSTAVAFAEQAATAHTSFATTGAEGYVGALEQGGNAGEVISSAREAMEASGIAADKWAAHRAKLEEQLNLKEAYQSQPDAADKEFLLAE